MRPGHRLILSCEHAGNRVPAAYRHLFAANPDILNTHRGYDIGIAPIARGLQRRLGCPLCLTEWTRLLVDVNRTRAASQFSEFTRPLSDAERRYLLDTYDRPYKERLDGLVAAELSRGPVLHVSLHSFTPELKGQKRNAEIGILYDPGRKQEVEFAGGLQARLRTALNRCVRRNYPYLGNADGMTTRLRRRYDPSEYLGIEIELNQGFLASLSTHKRADFLKTLAGLI